MFFVSEVTYFNSRRSNFNFPWCHSSTYVTSGIQYVLYTINQCLRRLYGLGKHKPHKLVKVLNRLRTLLCIQLIYTCTLRLGHFLELRYKLLEHLFVVIL